MSRDDVRGGVERGSLHVIFVLNCINRTKTSQNPRSRLLCVKEHPFLQNNQCMLRSVGGDDYRGRETPMA
jgi:hypothetical protein